MQTTSPSPSPSAEVVGNAFVEQYYHILHHSPELVYKFYQDSSVLSRPEPNGLMTTVTTMQSINDKICSLDYHKYKAEIKTADAQDSFNQGVIVLVTGCLTGNDNLRKFTQTFFLAPQDKGYYVLNDVFRYMEESEPEISTGIDVVADETPSTITTQDPEPCEEVYPLKPEHANSDPEEIGNITEKDTDEVNDERPAIDNRDIVVEAESHLNENHASVAEESVTSPYQEDVPKKSYASILSSQTKKGPSKVYVPASSARVGPAKTEKQTADPATEALVSEASAPPRAPVNAPKSDDAPDEVEGYSIYVRNLPLNATVPQLEAEFKRFGPIKQNGIQIKSNQQQGFCFGFVEFQEFSSMQSAIKASPITIEDHQVAVEIKRTTLRAGSGRGRFTTSRGGFRNDNFRGGRTYGRNDNLRGRGHFSGPRRREGYHQQGSGSGSPNLDLASP